MPIKVMTVQEADAKYRQARKSTITSMPEWEELKLKLTTGLRRSEAVVIELMPDPRNKNLRAGFKRNVRKMVKRLNLGYSVRAMRDGSSGHDIVVVANDEQPVSTRLPRKRA
jgi:hypothetical protein